MNSNSTTTRVPGTPLAPGDLFALISAQQDQIDDLGSIVAVQHERLEELHRRVAELTARLG
jgi:hypothetical protein